MSCFTEYLRPDLRCPCAKCKEKAPGCLESCESYADWREQEEKRKADARFRADASKIDGKRSGRRDGRRDGINNWYAKNGRER